MSLWLKRPRSWFLIILGVAMAGGIIYVTFLFHEGREKADQWSSVLSGMVGASAALASLLLWLWRLDASGREVLSMDHLDKSHRSLAVAYYEQWVAEERSQGVQDPWPLPVRWAVSDRAGAVMASWASIRGEPGAAALDLEGSFKQISRVFLHPQSPRRLVILGEAGSGKSMLVLRLTLDLLRLQAEEEESVSAHTPVPVLLSATDWDPRNTLEGWVTDKIVKDYPRFGRPVTPIEGSARSLAAELFARGRILPVVDGFDEMPEANQEVALRAISRAIGAGRPVVLACRTTSFEAVVAEVGPLVRTPVVELQPLEPGIVARYLLDGTEHSEARWNNVVNALRSGTHRPLSDALSTPLMIWLARTVYYRYSTNPDELISEPWAGSSSGIQRHLFEQLVPAVYGLSTHGHPARDRTAAEQAREYLSYLAKRISGAGLYDLAWWQVQSFIPRSLPSITAGLVAGLATGVAGVWANGPEQGAVSGIMAAIAATVVVKFAEGAKPQRIVLRHLRRSDVIVGITFGAIGGIGGGLYLGLVLGLVGGLAVGVASISRPTDDRYRALSPSSLLAADREAAMVAGVAAAFVGGWIFYLSGGIWEAVGGAIGFSLAGVLATSWGRFCLARAVLAMRREMPARMMVFLKEARDRGVLRQAGATYQFRHNELRDRLALPAQARD